MEIQTRRQNPMGASLKRGGAT